MKIVLLESLGVSKEKMEEFLAELEKQGHQVSCYERTSDIGKQIEYAKDADILIIANMPLSGEVIRACSHLKFIDVAFTGVDHVDLEAAKEKNIAVSNASGYSTQAVAELAIAMMIDVLRNVSAVEERCRAGQTKDGLVGCELGSKTVGIVGTGNIGKKVAEICKAFGCNVLGYRRHPDANDGIEYVSLPELLEKSDIVSLHCPANASTKDLINKETIGMMKDGAVLINTARGAVVNTKDLADALNSGKLSGAGIDVFDVEPPLPTDNLLLHTPHTLVTPHVAFATKESMELRADIVLKNILEWESGNQINVIL